MSTTLSSLARECNHALSAGNTPAARAKAAELLGQALREAGFVRELFALPMPERKVVYEDPELGFCILVHEYRDAREGGPHDHGPSWAIYGQAEGETVMTEFELVDPPSDGQPGRVRPVRSYAMRPGDVHVYNEGEIHAPRRAGPCKLVRIEGRNLEGVRRGSYALAAG
jgi:hypothetical protein